MVNIHGKTTCLTNNWLSARVIMTTLLYRCFICVYVFDVVAGSHHCFFHRGFQKCQKWQLPPNAGDPSCRQTTRISLERKSSCFHRIYRQLRVSGDCACSNRYFHMVTEASNDQLNERQLRFHCSMPEMKHDCPAKQCVELIRFLKQYKGKLAEIYTGKCSRRDRFIRKATKLCLKEHSEQKTGATSCGPISDLIKYFGPIIRVLRKFICSDCPVSPSTMMQKCAVTYPNWPELGTNEPGCFAFETVSNGTRCALKEFSREPKCGAAATRVLLAAENRLKEMVRASCNADKTYESTVLWWNCHLPLQVAPQPHQTNLGYLLMNPLQEMEEYMWRIVSSFSEK